MVNGGQQTTAWHVDDVRVSHIDPKVSNLLVQFNKDKCEDNGMGLVKAANGKVHNCLGMNFDFTSKGKGNIVFVK